MWKSKVLAVAVLALSCAAAASPADARGYDRGPRVSIGLHFGAPLYAHPHWHARPYYRSYHRPYYAYPRAYAYPPVVVVPSAPPVYIERQPAPQVQAPTAGYWHYCAESNAYYPYVKECAGQWQLVPPSPQQ